MSHSSKYSPEFSSVNKPVYRFKPWWLVLVSIIFALLLIQAVQAISHLSISIDKILIPLYSREGYSRADKLQNPAPTDFLKSLNLDKLKLDMDIGSDPAIFIVSLAEFNLPEPYKKLRQFQFSCQSLDIQTDFVRCQRGKLTLMGLVPEQNTSSSDVNLQYSLTEQTLSLSIKDINIGQGELSLKFNITNNNWQVDFKAKQLSFKEFKAYFSYYYPDFMSTINAPGFSLSASGHLEGQFAKDEQDKSGGLKGLRITGQVNNLHYTHIDDMADKLSFNFNYKLTNNSPDSTKMTLDLSRLKGEIFQNDIYLAFTGKEKIHLNLLDDKLNKAIKINRIKLVSNKVLDIESSAYFKHNNFKNKKDYQLRDFHIAFKLNDLKTFNTLYLKNILEGTDYEGLDIEGGVKGYFGRSGRKLQLNTIFNQFNLDFNGQIAVLDLKGELNWNNHKSSQNSPVSHLNWQELQLNELPFGKTRLNFVTFNEQLSLLQETDIPLFDGALHINSLELTQIGQAASEQNKKQGLTIKIDGLIKPVSLKLVSEHFNWPVLDGKLSAVIPATSYNSHLLTVGGAMMMQVFDGTIIFKDLKIEHPLEDNAFFFANIDLLNIDLESLTKTFNFGEIEGRMEGRIKDLELNAWSPVAFDATFKTPENDKSRHRISQRAIDNLSSLGGASGILSRSFLSIFETFRYDKIGLSCKLKDNVCHMNGIEAKGDNAYYIVKGSGLPRIDVLGFQKTVNWQTLISRLKNIQSANEAVIE